MGPGLVAYGAPAAPARPCAGPDISLTGGGYLGAVIRELPGRSAVPEFARVKGQLRDLGRMKCVSSDLVSTVTNVLCAKTLAMSAIRHAVLGRD
jgi:hypothetical protein